MAKKVKVTAENPIKLFPDGDQWCALVGENLQEGICGFAETPEDAIAALQKKLPKGAMPELSTLNNWIKKPL